MWSYSSDRQSLEKALAPMSIIDFPLLLMQLDLISAKGGGSRLWGHFQDQTVQKGQAQHIEKELLLPVKQGSGGDKKGTKQRAMWRVPALAVPTGQGGPP